MPAVTRRVRRPKSKDQLIDELVGETGPFTSYRQVLVFAAALGFNKGQRKPFERSGEQVLLDNLLGAEGAEAVVNMIAVASVDDVNVLQPDDWDARLRPFEEYAHGGLEIIDQMLAHSTRRASDVLRDLVFEARQATPTPEPDIDAVLRALAEK
jgi:dnd system-associated protein 4